MSLENRGILRKGTTRRTASQEGRYLYFLRSLMSADLPLMKSVLTPLAESVLLSFGLTAAMSSTDKTIKKKIYGSDMTLFIISNESMEEESMKNKKKILKEEESVEILKSLGLVYNKEKYQNIYNHI